MAWKILHILLLLFYALGTKAAIFTLVNKCKDTIWPGVLSGSGKPELINGGFELKSGDSIDINAPKGWSGRMWARHECTFDFSGKGSCITGYCGGALKCGGKGGAPPATLAEFTLDSPIDYYDVSLVDGFNLPVSVFPMGGDTSGNNCRATHCFPDLNERCPKELQLKRNGRVVACKSACMAFNKPEYCCTGDYNSPKTCKPTNYSKVFKVACPHAYSYAYDDGSSTFTCKEANYMIMFC